MKTVLSALALLLVGIMLGVTLALPSAPSAESQQLEPALTSLGYVSTSLDEDDPLYRELAAIDAEEAKR